MGHNTCKSMGRVVCVVRRHLIDHPRPHIMSFSCLSLSCLSACLPVFACSPVTINGIFFNSRVFRGMDDVL